MDIAIVGAGLAGLATAAAFSRAGHEVRVFEQSAGLRADGLAINLWSNATSLLPGFGIPASRVPGEPFARMLLRAAGRQAASMELPPQGLPHVNVERGELLSALATALPSDAITYGVRCTDAAALASDHELVVVADGAGSALRQAVTRPPRRRWTWTVWQACITASLPEIPAGAGVSVIRPGLFAESGASREVGSRGSPSSRNANPVMAGSCSRICETTRTLCCGRWRTPPRKRPGRNGARRMRGHPGRCIAATSSWPATPRTPRCPLSARAPASVSKTPRSSPRRSPPRTPWTGRSGAIPQHASRACA